MQIRKEALWACFAMEPNYEAMITVSLHFVYMSSVSYGLPYFIYSFVLFRDFYELVNKEILSYNLFLPCNFRSVIVPFDHVRLNHAPRSLLVHDEYHHLYRLHFLVRRFENPTAIASCQRQQLLQFLIYQKILITSCSLQDVCVPLSRLAALISVSKQEIDASPLVWYNSSKQFKLEVNYCILVSRL